MKISTEDLQEYSKYILSEYKNIGGCGYTEVRLEQFIRENRMKDCFSPNSAQETKLNFIEIIKNDIEQYAKYMNKNLNLLTFNEFNNDNN